MNTLNMSEFENLTPMTDKHSKASKPDLFHGDRTKLESWLLQLNLYFHVVDKEHEWAEKDKVLLAATYMRGRAADWISPYVTKYLEQTNEEGDQVDGLIEDYNKFCDELRALFSIAN